MDFFKTLFKKKAKLPGQKEVICEVSARLDESIARIKAELGYCGDLTVSVSEGDSPRVACIYIEDLVDQRGLDIVFLKTAEIQLPEAKGSLFDTLKKCLSGTRKLECGTDFDRLCDTLLAGSTVFLVDGVGEYLALDTYAPEGRPVTEAMTQSTVRGPKEGFTEKNRVNIALLRRRLKSKALRVEPLVLGEVTHTEITLMYLDQIARPEIIAELKKRLNQIKIDQIPDSGYIEEFIKDDRYSIFPTFLNSEKPDAVVAALLEGRAAVLVDGSPFVLTAPAFFIEFFQASEDYYHHFIVSSLMRSIRFISFMLSCIVPAVFVALITFHQEMIPTSLLISIAAQREGVPFPSLVEALLMGGGFEVIMEAGIRMPRAIGSAITFVGALILGQAAVEAGVVSAVMVIVVSITAITSFAIANFSMVHSIKIIRLILLGLAGAFGLYGVFIGLMILVLHLSKLKSLGIPYLTPLAPTNKSGVMDTFVRFPLWKMKYRPVGINGTDGSRVEPTEPVDSRARQKAEFGSKK